MRPFAYVHCSALSHVVAFGKHAWSIQASCIMFRCGIPQRPIGEAQTHLLATYPFLHSPRRHKPYCTSFICQTSGRLAFMLCLVLVVHSPGHHRRILDSWTQRPFLLNALKLTQTLHATSPRPCQVAYVPYVQETTVLLVSTTSPTSCLSSLQAAEVFATLRT